MLLRPMLADRLSLWFAFSRTTSFGFLSSLVPRKTACRNRSSLVHSVNLTWQTLDGFTQRQRFISAAVNPWSQRLRPGAGRSEKGQLSTRIFCKSSNNERRSFSLNPVSFEAKIAPPPTVSGADLIQTLRRQVC